MTSILFTLRLIKNALKYTIHTRYKWLLLFFLIWLYRVDFVPDSGGGMGKLIQIASLGGMWCLVAKYSNGLLPMMQRKANQAVKSCVIFYIYAAFSLIWSIMPFFSAYMAFQNILFIFCFLWFFSKFQTFESLEKAFLLLAVGINLYEFVGARIVMGGARLFYHHLSSGSVAAIVVVYCISELVATKVMSSERRLLLRGSFFISMVMLIFSTSSGANAGALFGIAIGLLFSGRVVWSFLLFGGVFFLYVNQDMIEQIILFLNPGKSMAMIETGTGRRFIWDAIWDAFYQRPTLGYGFACVERHVGPIINIELVDAHNSYMGIIGSLGIVGGLLFGVHILFLFKSLFPYRKRIGFLGLFSSLSCVLLNGYSYGYLSGKTCSITLMYFILIILSFFYNKRRVSKNECVNE